MEKIQAKIHYLYHSGFAVETPNSFLIFDYYSDSPEKKPRGLSHGVITPKELIGSKAVFVFASHSHGDHFNPVILRWREVNPDIHYILSNDIKIQDDIDHCSFMGPYEERSIGHITIRSFGSTDIGISFLVEADGFHIFHAGDLNCWYWKEESTPEELERDEKAYLDEIQKMQGAKVDIAFFPVDPRLKEYFYLGGAYFIDQIKPDWLFPMHFGAQYSIIEQFADRMQGSSTQIARIKHRGQQFIFEKEREE